MAPTASKVAALVNPGSPTHRLIVAEELPQTARTLGVALPIVEATTTEELDIALPEETSFIGEKNGRQLLSCAPGVE
jgi:hypothetical protein